MQDEGKPVIDEPVVAEIETETETGAETTQAQPTQAPPEVTTETAEPAPGTSAAELEALLVQARATAEQREQEVLRSRAEMENLRKRTVRDVENAHKFGIERFVAELLPVMDSMELGVAAAMNESANVASVREGTELTLKMLDSALSKFNVEAVNPLGKPFDAEFHQAMSMQESGEAGSGNVLTVVQKGYLLNGRLVRPAMVIVAK